MDTIWKTEEICRCEDGGVCEPCGMYVTVDGVCRDCWLNMPTVMAALLRCTSNGHLECMKALVATGADVNGVVEDPACPCGKCPYLFMAPRLAQDYTPLMYVVLEHDDVECVKFLIEKGADVNKAHEKTGNTPVICAAEGGSYECLKFLIEEGADVNHANNKGYSALWYTVIRGKSKCTQVLIEAGADVNSRRDREPIWAAAYYGDVKCMEALIKAGAYVNGNGSSCGGGLRKAHSYGNEITLEKSTPLMDAMRCRNAKCVDLLISAGADVNVIDSHGNTPFIFSCYCGINTAKLLLQAGAKINMVNAFGGNAFEEILHDEYVALHGISPDKTMVLFLYAAGEIPRGNTLQRLKKYYKVKKQLKLKHLCRETIRNHLLRLDPQTHLFGRVTRLGLPASLTLYLLYNCTLDVESKTRNTLESDPKQ